MFKHYVVVLVSSVIALLALGCGPSENSLRSRVVKLTSARGSCSGEQVRAPSGTHYVLTAAHCIVLAEDGQINVITEDGRELKRRVIAEDDKSDLLLLEGVPALAGIDIAAVAPKGTWIRTFTHGKGHATYKTEGELLETTEIQILISMSMEPIEGCNKAKEKLISTETPFGSIYACLLSVKETFTQAMTQHGSSGGMVVNNEGELVGVVSAGDGNYSALVTLSDIKAFLNNY